STGAGAHTARRENPAKRRHTPEVGAVCPNWARTDLCGGRAVMRVPTAINGGFLPAMVCPLMTHLESRPCIAADETAFIIAGARSNLGLPRPSGLRGLGWVGCCCLMQRQ